MKEAVSELVKKELGIEKAKLTEEERNQGKILGNLNMEQVVKIALEKRDDILAKSFKVVVKQIVGSISSMQGITIEGKAPKEVLKEIDEGKWDKLLNIKEE